jgi:HlyD family secretion protein
VYVGQEAVLRFSAFPSRTTPRFEGRIVRVAGDAARDERTGLAWYELEVAMGDALETESSAAAWLEAAVAWLRSRLPWLSEPELQVAAGHARDLALTPGMPVEVYVRTGERSPLSYLAKPLADYFSRSLRED